MGGGFIVSLVTSDRVLDFAPGLIGSVVGAIVVLLVFGLVTKRANA